MLRFVSALTSSATIVFITTIVPFAPAQAQTPAPQQLNADESGVPKPTTAPSVLETGKAPDSSAPVALDQFAEKIQELMSKKMPGYVDRKEDQAAIEAFYRQRGFQPLWTANGAPAPRTSGAVETLKNASREGLNPADYPAPDFQAGSTADAVAANDLQLTHSILKYARHVNSGRVSFTRVSGAILYPSNAPDLAQVLAQIAASDDVAATMESFAPPQPGYKALKAQLAKEVAAAAAGRVAPEEIAPKSKQRNVPAKSAAVSKQDLIIANMERWRWLPRDLGPAHVIVNVPNYTLQLHNNGSPVWATKIVVGKPGEQATPLLSETMKYLTVNPTWNVPPSIIRNEYLPALQRDPGALERIGLKIGRNHDGSVRVYQPPGDKNALGRIRFNFPNPFLVYQHDTPNKHLFAQDRRALSHGCMRVQHPEKYAEALLSISQPKDRMTAESIKRLYGDEERTIGLKHPIPVHVTYQTAFVDAAGHLVTRDDIYGLDKAVINLMRGDERAIADRAIPRDYHSSSKPVLARLPARGFEQARGSEQEGRDRRKRYDFVSTPFASGTYDRAVGFW